jgi:hypothetical protein
MAAILFEDVWSGGGDTRSSKSTPKKKQIKKIHKNKNYLLQCKSRYLKNEP